MAASTGGSSGGGGTSYILDQLDQAAIALAQGHNAAGQRAFSVLMQYSPSRDVIAVALEQRLQTALMVLSNVASTGGSSPAMTGLEPFVTFVCTQLAIRLVARDYAMWESDALTEKLQQQRGGLSSGNAAAAHDLLWQQYLTAGGGRSVGLGSTIQSFVENCLNPAFQVSITLGTTTALTGTRTHLCLLWVVVNKSQLAFVEGELARRAAAGGDPTFHGGLSTPMAPLSSTPETEQILKRLMSETVGQTLCKFWSLLTSTPPPTETVPDDVPAVVALWANASALTIAACDEFGLATPASRQRGLASSTHEILRAAFQETVLPLLLQSTVGATVYRACHLSRRGASNQTAGTVAADLAAVKGLYSVMCWSTQATATTSLLAASASDASARRAAMQDHNVPSSLCYDDPVLKSSLLSPNAASVPWFGSPGVTLKDGIVQTLSVILTVRPAKPSGTQEESLWQQLLSTHLAILTQMCAVGGCDGGARSSINHSGRWTLTESTSWLVTCASACFEIVRTVTSARQAAAAASDDIRDAFGQWYAEVMSAVATGLERLVNVNGGNAATRTIVGDGGDWNDDATTDAHTMARMLGARPAEVVASFILPLRDLTLAVNHRAAEMALSRIHQLATGKGMANDEGGDEDGEESNEEAQLNEVLDTLLQRCWCALVTSTLTNVTVKSRLISIGAQMQQQQQLLGAVVPPLEALSASCGAIFEAYVIARIKGLAEGQQHNSHHDGFAVDIGGGPANRQHDDTQAAGHDADFSKSQIRAIRLLGREGIPGQSAALLVNLVSYLFGHVKTLFASQEQAAMPIALSEALWYAVKVIAAFLADSEDDGGIDGGTVCIPATFISEALKLQRQVAGVATPDMDVTLEQQFSIFVLLRETLQAVSTVLLCDASQPSQLQANGGGSMVVASARLARMSTAVVAALAELYGDVCATYLAPDPDLHVDFAAFLSTSFDRGVTLAVEAVRFLVSALHTFPHEADVTSPATKALAAIVAKPNVGIWLVQQPGLCGPLCQMAVVDALPAEAHGLLLAALASCVWSIPGGGALQGGILNDNPVTWAMAIILQQCGAELRHAAGLEGGSNSSSNAPLPPASLSSPLPGGGHHPPPPPQLKAAMAAMAGRSKIVRRLISFTHAFLAVKHPPTLLRLVDYFADAFDGLFTVTGRADLPFAQDLPLLAFALRLLETIMTTAASFLRRSVVLYLLEVSVTTMSVAMRAVEQTRAKLLESASRGEIRNSARDAAEDDLGEVIANSSKLILSSATWALVDLRGSMIMSSTEDEGVSFHNDPFVGFLRQRNAQQSLVALQCTDAQTAQMAAEHHISRICVDALLATVVQVNDGALLCTPSVSHAVFDAIAEVVNTYPEAMLTSANDKLSILLSATHYALTESHDPALTRRGFDVIAAIASYAASKQAREGDIHNALRGLLEGMVTVSAKSLCSISLDPTAISSLAKALFNLSAAVGPNAVLNAFDLALQQQRALFAVSGGGGGGGSIGSDSVEAPLTKAAQALRAAMQDVQTVGAQLGPGAWRRSSASFTNGVAFVASILRGTAVA